MLKTIFFSEKQLALKAGRKRIGDIIRENKDRQDNNTKTFTFTFTITTILRKLPTQIEQKVGNKQRPARKLSSSLFSKPK